MADVYRGQWVVLTSFLFALVLSVVSVISTGPDNVGHLRPDWVLMVLIYWVMALPQRVGIVAAWCLGIVVDVLSGSLIGQHAVAYILVSYAVAQGYQQLRMISVWQQSVAVLVLVGASQLISIWIQSIAGMTSFSWWHMLPAVVSAFIWPWIFLVLRYLRRQFRVT